MSVPQFQTVVPADGFLSLQVPEFLRGETIILQPVKKPEQQTVQIGDTTDEERLEFQRPREETISDLDWLNEPPMSDEEYEQQTEWLQGSWKGTLDLSDLREEEDREI